jgi:hypothetical protein
MINEWQLWLLLKLDALHGAFVVSAILIVGAIAAAAVWSQSYVGRYTTAEEDEDERKRRFRLVFGRWYIYVIAPLMLALSLLTPSTKEALIIFGVPKLLNSQQETLAVLERMPLKVTKALDSYIEDLLKDDEKAEEKESK